MKSDLNAIIDLKLVAYGNTQFDYEPEPMWRCQHGEGECQTDALDLCVQYLLGDSSTSVIADGSTSKFAFPFILCMENEKGDPKQGQSCFESTFGGNGTPGTVTANLTWPAVSTCASKDQGGSYNTVMMAAMTATPTHKFVPWVLVNDKLLQETQDKTLQYQICKAYTGPSPPSCKAVLAAGDKAGTATPFDEVRAPLEDHKSYNFWW